jgi:hypothetical protein
METMSIPTDVERDLPPALKETQDPGWLPGLDIPDLTDDQLIAMARRIENHAHIRWCWHVLAYNRSSAAIRDAARRDLRKSLFGDVERCGNDEVTGGWAEPGMTCERPQGHDGHHRSGSVTWLGSTMTITRKIDLDQILDNLRTAKNDTQASRGALGMSEIARSRMLGYEDGIAYAIALIETATR